MIEVDITKTRVFQEGLEEGIERVARRLLKMRKPIAEIVQATGLTTAQIRKLNKKPRGQS